MIFKRNVGALYESKSGIKYDLLYICKSPEHLFYNFNDYSVCCAAIDNREVFWHHEDYFKHCENKELYYIEKYPHTDLSKQKRLKKYLNKGFSINSKNLLLWLEKMHSDKKLLKKKPFDIKQVFYRKLENLKFKTIKTKIKE